MLSDIDSSAMPFNDQVTAKAKLVEKALSEGVDTTAWVVRDPSYYTSDHEIDWPRKDGFTLNSSGNAIYHDAKLNKDDIIDRDSDQSGEDDEGIFVSRVIDGKSESFGGRSLPYVENKNCLSTYKVLRDFSELSDAIDNCSNADLKTELKAYIKNYDVSLSDIREGNVAKAFGEDGGADQIKLPISIKYLVKLGFLKKIN